MNTTIESIKVLDPAIANKIAAGEVVERPASVIKELVENSIDAGANTITIEITEGGITYMRVSDNGCGMGREDAKNCFLRHATSKIHETSDLFSIKTLGFRGEAMASIAAVARVTLKTHRAEDDFGTTVIIDGGKIRDVSPCGCPDGTILEVSDLFYNVPARLKFLKASKTEASYVSDYILRMILGRPDISFKFINNGKIIYHSKGDGNLTNAIYSVYGAEIIPHLKQVSFSDGYLDINGFVGDEQVSRPTRAHQSMFVNGRYIKSAKLASSLLNAYNTRIMTGRFPFAVLSFAIAYENIDVNVHPNKLEVKFADEQRVSSSLYNSVKASLGCAGIPVYQFDKEIRQEEKPQISDSIKKQLFEELMSQANFNSLVQQQVNKNNSVCDNISEQKFDTNNVQTNVNQINAAFEIHNDNTHNESNKVNQTINADYTEHQSEIPFFPSDNIVQPLINDVQEKTRIEQTELEVKTYKILGNLFESFWLISQNENLFILDQHAAHERILYEKAMNGTLKAQTQSLLIPIIVKLTSQEYNIYSDNMELFTEFGFIIEQFGTLTLRITAVPYILDNVEDDRFFKDTLSMLSKQKNVSLKDMKREVLIRASCKSAIKLGNTVPNEMIEDLLNEYNKDGVTLTCPHGRPVMIAITKNDLFKKFKRIV